MSWWDTSLHAETLTVVQVSTGPPVDGIPQTTRVERDLLAGNVQQVGTSESVGNHELVTERVRWSGPPAEWVQPGDEVLWRGRRYRVDGEPAHFRGGVLDHTEFVLIIWKG